MTDHPILFNAPMIRALLREIEAPGTGKTQTRRILKPQPALSASSSWHVFSAAGGWVGVAAEDVPERASDLLLIQPGDRLWARETWAHYHTVNHIVHSGGRAFSEVSDGLAGYRADGHDSIDDFRDHVRLMSGCDLETVEINGGRWRPSIHMPRWASRLTLYVTKVSVERLQDISEADALAEGICIDASMPEDMHRCWLDMDPATNGADWLTSWDAKDVYRQLWHHLHGPGAWEANPWVSVMTFRPVLGNIDGLPATLQEAV